MITLQLEGRPEYCAAEVRNILGITRAPVAGPNRDATLPSYPLQGLSPFATLPGHPYSSPAPGLIDPSERLRLRPCYMLIYVPAAHVERPSRRHRRHSSAVLQADATLTRPGRGHLTGYQLVQVSPWPDSHWMDNFTTYREARHRNTLPRRRAPRDNKPKRQRWKMCTAPRAVCSSERVSRRAILKRLAGVCFVRNALAHINITNGWLPV